MRRRSWLAGALVLGTLTGCTSQTQHDQVSSQVRISSNAGPTGETNGYIAQGRPVLWSATDVCLRSGQPQKVVSMSLRDATANVRLVKWGIRDRFLGDTWATTKGSYADQPDLPNKPGLVTSVPGYSTSTAVRALCSDQSGDTRDQVGLSLQFTGKEASFVGIWLTVQGGSRYLLPYAATICPGGTCPRPQAWYAAFKRLPANQPTTPLADN